MAEQLLTPENLAEARKKLGEILNELSPLFAAVLFSDPKAENFIQAVMKCPKGKYDYRIILQKHGRDLPTRDWEK